MAGKSIKIAPSIMAANWVDFHNEVKKATRGDFIHVDIMDAHFVPNITLGPDIARAIYKLSQKPLDIHLMLERPDLYLHRFSFEGIFRITFHYESNALLTPTLRRIKSLGFKAGISISPDTPVKRILKIVDKVDQVLVMTVYPGFSGQRLVEKSIPKVYELAEIREKLGLNFVITVDGGINKNNINKLGPIDEAVIGSAFFK